MIIYSVLLVQAFVGFTQYFVPGLYGGVDNAKAVVIPLNRYSDIALHWLIGSV